MRKIIFILFAAIIIFAGLVAYDYIRFFSGRLLVTFCDVGQGDAIFVRTPGGKNILIDGGPDTSVLSCLANNMPFWERHIDILILSHPHDDHFAGMYYLLDRYDVRRFVTEELNNPIVGYEALKDKIKSKKIPATYAFRGDIFQIKDGVTIEILGPTNEYIEQTSPNGNIGERAEFASLIVKLSYGSFHALFTGDSQKEGLAKVSQQGFHNTTILQAPHHGSRSGLDKNMIRLIDPKMAIISVGKNNYGHPSKELLKLLVEEYIPVKRTDQMGDIHIQSDGKSWSIK